MGWDIAGRKDRDGRRVETQVVERQRHHRGLVVLRLLLFTYTHKLKFKLKLT